MLLLITCIVFFISNLSLATKCGLQGDACQEDDDCCSDFTCFTIKEINACLPSIIHGRWKRNVDDLIIPPYYEQKQQLYPYGIDKPALPFYKAQEPKQPVDNKNFEWDQCQFHEDCGEENCCISHLRFRSARKWFCRPKQHDVSEACEPLTKYRSMKNVPVWTEQLQQQETNEELLR